MLLIKQLIFLNTRWHVLSFLTVTLNNSTIFNHQFNYYSVITKKTNCYQIKRASDCVGLPWSCLTICKGCTRIPETMKKYYHTFEFDIMKWENLPHRRNWGSARLFKTSGTNPSTAISTKCLIPQAWNISSCEVSSPNAALKVKGLIWPKLLSICNKWQFLISILK